MQKKFILISLVFIALLQLFLLISFQHLLGFLSPFRLIALAAIELALGLMIFSALTGKLASLSITIWLLLFVNFVITPIDFKRNAGEYLTLPPNLHYKLEIVGDAMPGFTGIQHVSTDELGFRTTKKINYNNKGSTYRIFTIGGSTTEEIYTDNLKTWSALLQEELTKPIGKEVEVINTGFAGLRARHHHKTLEQILQYKPDAAIFLMGINDWNHHIKASVRTTEASEDKAAKDAGKPRIERKTMPTLSWTRSFDITKSLLWKSIQRVAGKELITKNDGSYYYTQNHSVNRDDWRRLDVRDVADDYKESVGKIIDLCEKSGIKCLFANQPHAYQANITDDLMRRLWMTPPNEPYSIDLTDVRHIAQVYNRWLVNRTGNNSCDISMAFAPTTDHLIDDCHFNPSGSAILAQKISECFIQQFSSK